MDSAPILFFTDAVGDDYGPGTYTYPTDAVFADGAFDITAAPLTELWKSYIKKGIMPDQKEIDQRLELVDFNKVVLDANKNSIRFLGKDMKIDLAAIAKGYAVDKAIGEIRKQKIHSALVNAGGDIFCLGKRFFIFPWRVGIRDPNQAGMHLKTVRLIHEAVATSGGYEQFLTYNGKSYSHLINPKTGYPVDDLFSSVTVIAETCLIADAMATAISIGGRETEKRLKSLYPHSEIIIIE